jgi:4-alpha-glucanotransferase
MRFPRAGGILLHPTSLPGRYGIGDLGDEAHRLLDLLADAKQRLWQVLPLGPTGYGDSPYQCFSAFAGNPLLVSPDRLVAHGLLSADDLRDAPSFPEGRVDFGAVIPWKVGVLETAARCFRETADQAHVAAFDVFCGEQGWWLDDYALFRALKEHHGGAVWSDWPRDVARRQPDALRRARVTLADAITAHKVMQFAFFRQWAELRRHARERDIRIIGDMPIFVAYDSADVWAHPELFFLDDEGKPSVVAGVPPDYFSETGQLWGNPLYRWDVMAEQGFAWWIERLRTTLAMVDVVRVDHFIGFHRYWEIPADATTAIDGRWMPGPRDQLIQALRDALGTLPIIAEDLGLVTPEVEALRDRHGIPGMRVLQFAFTGDPTDRFLPHHYVPHTVVYTGTHDNDTTLGWFRSAPEHVRNHVLRYLARDGHDLVWDVIRAAMSSVADTVVIPMQDVLCLDESARMNVPGSAEGNWSWRLLPGQLDADALRRLKEMTELYAR